jgi:homoserine kinase
MFISNQGVRVTVPATSANLGPGFDVLGLALALYNTFTVLPADKTGIEIEGFGGDLPRDDSNLFLKAFAFLFEQAQAGAPPPVHVNMALDIPAGSGLGSSATAVVGGLVAANTLLGGRFGSEALIRYAVQLEHGNHADNVAPALLGGLVINVYAPSDGACVSLPIAFPDDLAAVLLIPDFSMDTVQGRALMPSVYAREDVVYTTGRVALLVAALQTRRYDLLRFAMQDRLHQPYRTQVYPMMPGLIASALDAGAYGACLSGGGSSILAFASVEGAASVADALVKTAAEAGLNGTARVVGIDHDGAKAELL